MATTTNETTRDAGADGTTNDRSRVAIVPRGPGTRADVDGQRGWRAEILWDPKPKGNSKRIVYFGKRCRICKRGRPSIQATAKEVKHEAALTTALRLVRPSATFVGPVVLCASIRLPIRPSWDPAKQERARAREHHPCSAKGASGPIPDLTNLIKMLEDALEKAGWLSNDSLVAQHRTEKIYHDEPGYVITVRELP